MRRFETRKEAESARNDLIKNADAMKRRKGGKVPTLKEAVDYWLKSKKDVVSSGTYQAYSQISRDYIIGPALSGDASARRQYGITGKLSEDASFIPMLGAATKIDTITTSDIRMWYLRVLELSTSYVAKCAKRDLSSVFRLIEEDFEIRLARMPSRPGPLHRRSKRKLLSQDQVRAVLDEAKRDSNWGIYYAFPFLTGVRPSEMLGLLWSDVDFENQRIQICRTQNYDGTLKSFTKTEAGMREVPLNSLLFEMLQDWKTRCPLHEGQLHRVFPAQGYKKKDGSVVREGGPLLLHNFWDNNVYDVAFVGIVVLGPYFIGEKWEDIKEMIEKRV